MRSILTDYQRRSGATLLLGHPYDLVGTVTRGQGRGRTIGFPTANIHADNEVRPGMGVYAVRAFVGAELASFKRPDGLTLLAGLQTISPSYYEAASLDGASDWQQFRYVTLPLLTPIIAVVMTFSVLMTFTDFQLIYVLTRGGPLNSTHLMATLSFQRAISGGSLGEGAAIATAMVPFLLAAILVSYYGLQRRAWQQGGSDK
jgi:ABC-type uncharacterized transport system permease subunit